MKTKFDPSELNLGKRRKKETRVCACGCGEKFKTSIHDQYYKNAEHRKVAKKSGIRVDPKKYKK